MFDTPQKYPQINSIVTYHLIIVQLWLLFPVSTALITRHLPARGVSSQATWKHLRVPFACGVKNSSNNSRIASMIFFIRAPQSLGCWMKNKTNKDENGGTGRSVLLTNHTNHKV